MGTLQEKIRQPIVPSPSVSNGRGTVGANGGAPANPPTRNSETRLVQMECLHPIPSCPSP